MAAYTSSYVAKDKVGDELETMQTNPLFERWTWT